MVFLDPVLNPVFLPVLNFSPMFAILLLSFLISLIILVVYKFFTNQAEMKRLKETQTEYQKKMKELRNNPEELMKVQKEAMKQNMDYMKHSFKATLITFLPVILIFGWMNAHFAYDPILPNSLYEITTTFGAGAGENAELVVDKNNTEIINDAQQKIVDDKATWRLRSLEGEHIFTVRVGKEAQSKTVLVTTDKNYAEQITFYENSGIKQITIDYKKLLPAKGWPLPWLNTWGWLGWYILSSLLFSLGLRKVMKVY